MTPAIAHFWAHSDEIGHLIGWLLLIMSVLSWTLVFFKAWSFWRVRKAATVLKAFWMAPTMTDA
ncbi:MAG: MotA/TolQ/ExbB proton channel family protein, partial [Burkholderiales bacterium]|nr:MotA/TolQ/ExbB proton channel family protein [Burkholderiales bacterium]